MITITLAQLQSAGFSIVVGSGQRMQVWTGADAEGNGVMYAFDSAKDKAIEIDDASPATVALFATAAVLIDVIGVLAIGGPAKAAAIKQITDALERI